MKSVDERLVEVLEFLYEENGVSVDNLDEYQKKEWLIKNRLEIGQIKATINYLKDYAKMQVVAQSFDKEEAEKHIDEAVDSLNDKIASIKNDIANLPAKKRKNFKTNDLLGYETSIIESKIRKVDEFNASIDNQKNSLKSEIKAIQGKIKELKSMKKDLSSQNKMIDRLFSEEKYRNNMDCSRIINMCVSSITQGWASKELIGEDSVFSYDNETGNYSVNKKNFKKFVSTIKKKNDIMKLTDFILTTRNQKYAEDAIIDFEKKLELNQKIREQFEDEDFKYIHNEINGIIEANNKLIKDEYRDYEGNKVKKAIRSFVAAIGLRNLAGIPCRKVMKERNEIKSKIHNLYKKVKYIPKMRELFADYMSVRSSLLGQEEMSAEDLEAYLQNLELGISRVELPHDTLNMEEFSELLTVKDGDITERLHKVEGQSDSLVEEARLKEEGLTKTARKIYESYSPELILEMANDYHNANLDGRKDRNIVRKFGNETLSQTAAVMILETIIGRKKLSFDEILDSYSRVLSKSDIEKSKIDLSTAIENKVQKLHDDIERYMDRNNGKEKRIFEEENEEDIIEENVDEEYEMEM